MKILKLLSALSITLAMLTLSNAAAAQAGPDIPPLSTCCPPLTTYPVTTMFNSVQANVGGNYHLNFTMAPAFSAQMQAYTALLKSLDSTVLATVVVAAAYDGGTAGSASAGALLQVGLPYWIAPTGPSGILFPPFFTSVADRPANTWTVVQMTAWVYRRGRWMRLCETRSFAFRPQLVGARLRSGAANGGFVDYRGPAPRVQPAPPPTIPLPRQ
jgi:hypothetical protein